MSKPKFSRHITLTPADNQRLASLCGPFNENLLFIESHLGVEINNRGNEFDIVGIPTSVDIACDALLQLYDKSNGKDTDINKKRIHLMLKSIETNTQALDQDHLEKLKMSTIYLSENTIKPRTLNQGHYIRAIYKHDINFGIGPSGTGKTYLAVACALAALEKEQVSRIVLVRPAVEAGESLGFLPGGLAEKIDPYLRPIYDALYESLGGQKITSYLEKNIIEIAPLAYMRGRTLNDSFVILDEAQNATQEQMKMFLTRIGFGSKAAITGDITQTDLPKHIKSGLRHAITLLKDISEIHFTFFTALDVVRHPLVQRIIQAYEKEDADS